MPNFMPVLGEKNNGVEAKDYSHGSGSIDKSLLLSAESSDRTEGEAEDAVSMDYQEGLSCIKMAEDAKLVYNPASMGIGSGFYALHPITFNLL